LANNQENIVTHYYKVSRSRKSKYEQMEIVQIYALHLTTKYFQFWP